MNLESHVNGQKEFHSRADMDRVGNRCNNPYIRKREQKLAANILSKLPPAGKTVLEIGGGEGTNLLYLNALNNSLNYTGIDFSKEKIEAFQGFPENILGIVADATQLPFTDEEFDFVFLRDVLHHIDWARTQVMDEAWRVLKRGKTLIVFEANPFSPLNVIFWNLYPVERGMKNSSRKEMFELLNKYGSCSIEYLEPGYLVRAVSFIFWKSGSENILARYLLLPVCNIIEKLMYLMPKSFWPCRLYTIKKD